MKHKSFVLKKCLFVAIYDEKDEMPTIPKNYRTIDELTDAKIAFWISKIESELE